jgi:hypothetical protein
LHKIQQIKFLSAIGEIRRQTFKESTIKSAFRKTGIVPFKPSMVLPQFQSSAESEPTFSVVHRHSFVGGSYPKTCAQRTTKGEGFLLVAKAGPVVALAEAGAEAGFLYIP